jgi:hypothetical protein
MRPKARGMSQHGGPPGWMEESDPAGVILYVVDGTLRLPLPYRTGCPERSCLAACWWNFQLLLYSKWTQPSVMSYSYITQERHALVLYLWKSKFILAAAVHNNCHNTGPCFHLCEGLNCGTHCGIWVTPRYRWPKGLCSASFNPLWFTLCKPKLTVVEYYWLYFNRPPLK